MKQQSIKSACHSLFSLKPSARHTLLWACVMLLLSACSRPQASIAIQPLGQVPQVHIDSMQTALEKAYACPVYRLSEKALPSSAFVHIKSPRYRADSLLKHLLTLKPDSIGYIIGITGKDISTTKRGRDGKVKEPAAKYRDWGIFGLGYRPGRACIVSSFRLKNTDQKSFYDRLQKVSIHEIGHNKGLRHCPNEGCVMADAAETIKTVDKVSKRLCEKCAGRVVGH